MDIDTYLRNIDIIVEGYCNVNDSKMELDPVEPYKLDPNLISMISNMVEIKKQIITENEIRLSNVVHITTIDSLSLDLETKKIMTAIYIEICSKTNEKKFLRSLEKYKCEQSIFVGNDLFDHVRSCKELIRYDALQWHKIGNSCRYANKYYKASGLINEEILDFVHKECCNYSKFIRIEPYFCSDTMPPIFLSHEALRPVNPTWIKNLQLYKGQETGGHYILQEPIENQNDTDRLKHWEYNIYEIRSLEIHAQRSNSGNLSMMVEELCEKQTHEGFYTAKCIHLDSDNEVGTCIDSAVLNHIDLAVNVYNSEAFSQRRCQSLANGKVVDATLRTHLLRFEGVPFKFLIFLSHLFFKSQYLTREWISEQFE